MHKYQALWNKLGRIVAKEVMSEIEYNRDECDRKIELTEHQINDMSADIAGDIYELINIPIQKLIGVSEAIDKMCDSDEMRVSSEVGDELCRIDREIIGNIRKITYEYNSYEIDGIKYYFRDFIVECEGERHNYRIATQSLADLILDSEGCPKSEYAHIENEIYFYLPEKLLLEFDAKDIVETYLDEPMVFVSEEV